MSSLPDTLSADPSAESISALRESIARRMRGGARKSAIAREVGIEARTFAAFVDNPTRKPSGENWPKLRTWYASQRDQSRSGQVVTFAPIDRVKEGGPPYTADPVERVVGEGQRELSQWAKDFAAKLLRASAARIDEMPLPGEVTPTATGAVLETATARQLAADAAAAASTVREA